MGALFINTPKTHNFWNIFLDVFTDINVYPFPNELESFNFQYRYLLCPNQHKKKIKKSEIFVPTPFLFFEMFRTPKGLKAIVTKFCTWDLGIIQRKKFMGKSLIPRKIRDFELYSPPFFKIFKTF